MSLPEDIGEALSFMPLTQHWVPLLWPLIEGHIEEIPRSWPTTHDELEKWALGTRKQQTIADRSVILMQSDEGREHLPVGLITGDLVRGANSTNFPGAEFGDVNIAYMVFSLYRGQGIASRALNQVRQAWIEDSKSPVLRIDIGNKASQSVAEKAGFVYMETVEVNGRKLQLFRSI
ncbi:MAG TPA: GNAT family N-acetyltransferase [Acidimicrobiia bacterium]|nr:GNAT family N-acetyltransferase [Acidimicrobiia bacterium]